MRRRRDSFGRQTFVPVRERQGCCDLCGQFDPIRARGKALPTHRIYSIRVESDGGRTFTVGGEYCSWSCAEAYTGSEFPR